jgi:hypothetical protein
MHCSRRFAGGNQLALKTLVSGDIRGVFGRTSTSDSELLVIIIHSKSLVFHCSDWIEPYRCDATLPVEARNAPNLPSHMIFLTLSINTLINARPAWTTTTILALMPTS